MILSLLTGITVIFCNMAAQAVSERIDPRIRMEDQNRYEEVERL